MVGDRAAVLAVDGGNSKTDLALVAADGRLLAAVRGGSVSHQAVGLEAGMARLGRLASDLAVAAGRPAAAPGLRLAAEVAAAAGRPAAAPRPIADLGVFALAGADFASDVRLLSRSIDALGLVDDVVVVNDSLAALRAGSRRSWGIALICGQGVNGIGVAPDGRVARFDGVGDISGDWGGGTSVGLAGHAAAVRARDGRGARTSLETAVPAHFGFRSPSALVRALYEGRVDIGRIGELSPVVFAAAEAGDAVARSIVDRLADELGTMAVALLRRLHLTRLDPDVVLAGGVFGADDPLFHARLAGRIEAVASAARVVRLGAPPVLGAALIALDRLARVGDAGVDQLATDLRRWSAAVASGSGAG